jgi:hypothetical protein
MYNIFKGRLTGIRMLLMIAALGLILLGIATIYAVGNPAEPSEITSADATASIWKKQVVFAIFSCLAFAVVNMVHYRLLGSLSYWIYAMVSVQSVCGRAAFCSSQAGSPPMDNTASQLAKDTTLGVVQAGLYSSACLVSTIPKQL